VFESISRRHWNTDALLRQYVADILEPLILRDRDRTSVSFALQLPRRGLDVGLHQILYRRADGDQRPGTLRVVVHEDVVALLRILPEVEDLRHNGHIAFGSFPAEIRVNGEAARRLSVATAQIEYRLVVADARRARGQFVLG